MSNHNPNQSTSVSWWILEFLLRQPISDQLLHLVIAALPPPPSSSAAPYRVAKAIFLRRIASNPISETTLDSLEQIHRLNNAAPRLPYIQSAYLHAAVGSTLDHLKKGDLPEFLDAVDRIWRARVGNAACGLVSEELLEWKRKMEAAAESRQARDEVETGWRMEEGMAAIREYLVRELDAIGPPVLENAASGFIRAIEEGRLEVTREGRAEGERNEQQVGANEGEDENDVEVVEEEVDGNLSSKDENVEVEDAQMKQDEMGANLVGVSLKAVDGKDERREGEEVGASLADGDGTDKLVELEELDVGLKGEERIGEQVEREELGSTFRGEEETDEMDVSLVHENGASEQVEQEELDVGSKGEERIGEQVGREGLGSTFRGGDETSEHIEGEEMDVSLVCENGDDEHVSFRGEDGTDEQGEREVDANLVVEDGTHEQVEGEQVDVSLRVKEMTDEERTVEKMAQGDIDMSLTGSDTVISSGTCLYHIDLDNS